ncbi:putative NADPH-dependent methylglyoxal reductase GRP2 [Parachaetomium inaequale]|uniref:NADPH-dependent methylglyoxal reductase GRP2 n=1 Tax=Parachaetomium inaequale TaxID=2588326 RepID=A0AAN6PC08_9PEZI|nr:putative NADPH-dependent methylglyoxal reductase GRP2 [Parachaetomium inaequale]
MAPTGWNWPKPGPLVLLTGATGHVGSSTLLRLRQDGYRVRAAVRSEDQVASILALLSLEGGSGLTFVVIPDIGKPGAYDEAMKDVTFVIHCASPLATAPKTDLPAWLYVDHYFRPAVFGTLNILKAAHNAGTVQRIVFTSSLAAILAMDELQALRGPIQREVSEDERVPAPRKPYKDEFEAYVASKIEALKAAEEWMEEQRCRHDPPTFDAVYLHPGFVLGPNHRATRAHQVLRGGNSMIMAILHGFPLGTHPGTTVHVDDVAYAHVKALDKKHVPGNQSFMLCAPAVWEDTVDIVRKKFPGAFRASGVPVRESITTFEINAGTTYTQRIFNFKFASFEEQVESAMRQYLELRHEQDRKIQERDFGFVTWVKDPELKAQMVGYRL